MEVSCVTVASPSLKTRGSGLELGQMDMDGMGIVCEIEDVPLLGAAFEWRLGSRRTKRQWAKWYSSPIDVSGVLGHTKFGRNVAYCILHLEQTELANVVRHDTGTIHVVFVE
jgi:hypothetical protein